MVNFGNKYQHIIWDWNGTLLDDVEIVIDAMNILLGKRGLPDIDRDRYVEIFTFPVQEYYSLLGFDFRKEPFELLAAEFINEFNSKNLKLYEGVEKVISDINGAGYKQSILSATRQEDLECAVDTFGIGKFFDRISGLDNHFAVSKVEAGKVLLEQLEIRPDRVLLIGDTLHDFEVSLALGCDCLLISNGHQSYGRISKSNATIIKDISEVWSMLSNEYSIYKINLTNH